MRHEVLGQVAARLAALAAAAGLALSCSSSSSPAETPTIAIVRLAAAPSDAASGAPLPETSAPRPSGPREFSCGAASGPAVIAWESEERDARGRARRRGLPLLIYVRADWSAAALEMERKAWADPRVAEASRCFVALKLDVSSAEGDAELYAQRYGILRVPSTVIVDTAGHTVTILGGDASTDALLSAMQRWIE